MISNCLRERYNVIGLMRLMILGKKKPEATLLLELGGDYHRAELGG